MKQNAFPYSYYAKIVGLILILAGVFMFFIKYHRKGIYDINELAIGFSWGFMFIFFSKEKTDDEMIQTLKFKALARAMIISFDFTHLYNYIFLNWQLKRPNGIVLSVSAYQFLPLRYLSLPRPFITLNDRQP